MITIPMPDWYEAAVCASVDGELWFPEQGSNSREAKKICAACPVSGLCLDWALENGERFGVWGGKSERERRKLTGPRRCRACAELFTSSDPRERYCGDECRGAARRKGQDECEKPYGCIQCGAKSTSLRCRDCQHRHKVSQVMTRAQTKEAA